MKQPAVQPWRDPTFFGFLAVGVALLCSGLVCLSWAESEQPLTGAEAHAVPTAQPLDTSLALPTDGTDLTSLLPRRF